jgi:ATP-dependent protease HslVU (ClpYQ) peptidase subunit
VTAIAALIEGDQVWVGADSATYDGQNVLRYHPVKVAQVVFGNKGERLLIATTGSASLAQVAQHRLKVDAAPDPADTDDCNEWAFNVAAALAEAARDAHIVNKDSGGMDGAALLAWRHHLWHVTDHCALPVGAPSPYVTVGSGAEIALGALDVLADQDLPPAEKVVRAILAACRWEGGCVPPVHIAVTDGRELHEQETE